MNSLWLLAALLPAQPDGNTVVIFGREQWYRAVRGDQETFTGILQRIPGSDLESRCTFCLVMGEGRNATRDVFVAGQNQALANFANRRVRIIGTAIDLKVDGRMRYEIWPGRLELVGGGGIGGPVIGPGVGVGGLPNVLALGSFDLPLGAGGAFVRPGGPIQTVLRSQNELTQLCLLPQNANALLGQLGVQEIDWRRFMVVVCSAGPQRSTGYSIDIVSVDPVGQGWRVRWRLRTPPRGEVLNLKQTHPSKVFVLPKSEGAIRFEQVNR